MAKKYLNKDVYTAAMERIEFIFNNFDNILVAFSGGKDSGVCLNMVYEYAKDHDCIEKMGVYYMDYECGYSMTDEYVHRMFEYMDDKVKKYWLCLPISAQCSASMFQDTWIPWDKEQKGIWVKDYPNNKWVINEDNVPYQFKKGTYGKDAKQEFSKWFASKYGKTAVIIGLRADESLSRLSVITSQHRKEMYENTRYTKVVNNNTVNCYPIYDWTTEDDWVATAKFDWDYNKLYDLFYKAGLSIHQMRTASPFHISGQATLKLFKVIEPKMWGKMVSRVNGVNFTGIYGGTNAMGWQNITKPSHFTWKEYAEFLIETLPPKSKEKLLYHLGRLQYTWEHKGYGRNPDVIKEMESNGVELEKTGKISKLCTKDNIYEIVKIKNGFPDDLKIKDFRHCPNWKAICITIFKNDLTCQYMGCSRTKEDMERRKKTMEKYKNVVRGK